LYYFFPCTSFPFSLRCSVCKHTHNLYTQLSHHSPFYASYLLYLLHVGAPAAEPALGGNRAFRPRAEVAGTSAQECGRPVLSNQQRQRQRREREQATGAASSESSPRRGGLHSVQPRPHLPPAGVRAFGLCFEAKNCFPELLFLSCLFLFHSFHPGNSFSTSCVSIFLFCHSLH